MTNLEKLSTGLSEWAFTVAKSFLPQVRIPAGGKLGGLMQLIGMDPMKYNIWDELGFLAEPLIQTMVTPAVTQALSGIPDEQIPELALKYVDAFVKQAQEKGAVNLFGLGLGADAFQGLREILSSKFS